VENNLENAMKFVKELDKLHGEAWSDNSEELAKVLVDYANHVAGGFTPAIFKVTKEIVEHNKNSLLY